MLENYFIKPTTVDRIRTSWLAEPIESYVVWLAEKRYSSSTVQRRVGILRHFAKFAWESGARTTADLPAQVEPFIDYWVNTRRRKGRSKDAKRAIVAAVRVPVQQMVRVLIPEYTGQKPALRRLPFEHSAPGFFDYLSKERGLSTLSIELYTHNIRRFENYLDIIDLHELSALTPAVLSAFVTHCGQRLAKNSLNGVCAHLRIFLRFLYRESLVTTDLSRSIDRPRLYRLSTIPRSITWDEVRLMLEAVDQRSAIGKRDYAMLLLLVTYGLRAREIAALTLDDIDWKRERLQIPNRKAGHNTAFPLSPTVGDAIVAYLQHARPKSNERALFLCCSAPFGVANHHVISDRAACYLRKAGITVPRPGSHTLRHTCAQRLIDGHFSLKTIGDYLGHAHPISTQVYVKIDVEGLREVAIGDGEAVV